MSFPTTNWTLLAEATRLGDEEGRVALTRMCEDYRRPIAAYLRGRGFEEQQVEDMVQDFFLKLLNSRAWKRADRTKGRFRTYLLTILNHMLQQSTRNQHRQKRGGGIEPDSIEALMADGHEFAAQDRTGAALYDREWAFTVVETALATVEHEFTQRGQAPEFATLRLFLPGSHQMPTYENAAGELSLSLSAVKTAVHRLRQRFKKVLRELVARTVTAPHEVDEELRYLGGLLMDHSSAPQPGGKNGKERNA